MNYKDILNNQLVIEEYNKIDKVNPYPFNHGLKHVRNVCNIMNKLCDILEIELDKKDALLIACAFHDLGQVDGREHHGLKAKMFMIKNFNNQLKENKYYEEILTAVEEHDGMESNDDYSLFTKLVQFADKMDCSKDRLEDDYKTRFRYYVWENVEEIDFIYDNDVFGINFITDGVDDFYNKFLSENFSKKVINVTISLAHKLNRIPKMYVNNVEQKINM